MIRCGVCGRPLDYIDKPGRRHPVHTDRELAETARAVRAAGDYLAGLFLMDLARQQFKSAEEAVA